MGTTETEFLDMFVEEGREMMADIEAAILRLETAPADAESVQRLMRHAHSLKGSSAMMGLDDIRRIAHAVESLLEPIRDGARAVTRDVVDVLLLAADVLSRLVTAVREPAAAPAAERIGAVLALVDDVLAEGALDGPTNVSPGGETGAPSDGALSAPGAALRVPVAKVDRLMHLVGEMVTSQSRLAQWAATVAPDRSAGLWNVVSRLERQIRDLRESVMDVRMVAVRSLFARFPRLVRDVAGATGKRAVLELAGEETQIDTTVIERIADPLRHLIRNAIDHGLESPARRRAAGKPEIGRIRLEASQQGGSVCIDVSDDGAGLDRERILKKAIAQGLATEATGGEDVLALIMAPGFSTAEAVTNVSGRGVGLDIVRRAIETLGGSVSVHSKPGLGTRFRLTLPLTLATLDAHSR